MTLPLDAIGLLSMSDAAVDRIDVQRYGLRSFTKLAWQILEPSTPFIPNWHLDVMAEHLEAVRMCQINDLLINMPPRHCKSIAIAVMFPAWAWTADPSIRWLYSSYAQSLSIRDSVKMRRLIESPWYRARWGHVFDLTSDQNQKLKFENDKSGYRMATSVGGSNTGEGGDIIVVDDPHNVEQRESDVMREGAIDWWSNVMSTRINDPKKRRRIVVMQRVHEHDLAGHLLDQGGWHHLNLPAEYEGGKCIVTGCVFHWDKDPRKVEGEPLWPARYGKAEIAQLKKDLKEYGAAAQLQQRPAPAEGGILKRHWWRYWCYPGQEETLPPVRVKQMDGSYLEIKPVPLPYVFDRQAQSWDMSFKDLTTSSYVVGQQWGLKGPDSFCLDQVREQMDFTRTLEAVRSFNRTHKAPSQKVVEDKANGPAIISVLKTEIPGMTPHGVTGDKPSRAAAYSHLVHAGNCYLPHPSIAPWVEGFIAECATFPNSEYDDQVDTWSQAMDTLYKVDEPGVSITPEYSAQFHTARTALEPVQGLPSFRFWYQGIYPCCIIGQILSSGRIVLLDCLLGEENGGIEDLIDRKVSVVLAADYRGCTEWRDITNHGPLSKASQPSEHQLDQIIANKLQGNAEPGEPDFFTRLNALKALLSQTGRLTVNPAPTPGESKPWIHEALNGGYAFRQDQSGVISKSEARKFHPLTSVGEALGHGLAKIFLRKPIAPQKSNRQDAVKRAKSYAV
jgi:predicted phage terminase large subunit-like protein